MDKTINWEDILYALQHGKCALFIGEGAFKTKKGETFSKALKDKLSATNNINLYNDDGFLFIKKKLERLKTISEIESFYNESFEENLKDLKLLAQIPFRMIFSMSPDNMLIHSYDISGLDYHFEYFNKQVPENFIPPSSNKPLIYNLFGNISDPNSLVLTHSDFFNYLQLAFEGNRIHEDLKDEIEDTAHFIFLGLPFERWYFQLLLRILELHSNKFEDIQLLALNDLEDNKMTRFYSEEFKIDFIPFETKSFVAELHEKCKSLNLLKAATSPTNAKEEYKEVSFSELTKKIGGDKTEEVIETLLGHFSWFPGKYVILFKELILLKARREELKIKEAKNIISGNDLLVENSKIREDLISLIEKAKSK